MYLQYQTKWMIMIVLSFQILISIQQLKFQNFISKNETICVDQKRYIFIESDEPNIEEIKNIDQDLLQTSFKLNIKGDEIIQQLLVMNSLHFRAEFAFCFCQLIKSQNFQIFCIDGVRIDYEKNEMKYIKNAKQFKIQLLNTSDVVCDQMYSDIFNKLKVICQSNEQFFIYQINLLKQTTIKITNNLVNNNINCQKKQLQFEDKELIIFYQCEDWKIFLVENQELTLYLDQDNLLKYQIEIKFLSDAISCQQFLYLITFNNYYIFQQTKTDLYIFLQTYTENEILKLVITDRCEVIYSVINNQGNLCIENNQKSMETGFNYLQNQTEIFNLSQFLIIKNKSHLRILITKFISQNYQLLPSKLYQLNVYKEKNQISASIPNLFYQINYQTKVIQFYKFLKDKPCIAPQKKYLYEITTIPFCLLSNSAIQYEIIFQDNNYMQNLINRNPFQQFVYKDCNSIQNIQVQKDNISFLQIYELFVKTRPNNLIVSIEDEEELKVLCPNLDMDKNLQIIWIGKQVDEIILAIIENNKFYVFHCKNSKIDLQVDLQDKLVFTYKGNFFIAQLNRKQYQIILNSNYNNTHLLFEFKENIENIKQIQSNLLIQMSNEIIVFDLMSGSYNQLDEKFQQFTIMDYFSNFNSFIDLLQSGDFLLIKYKAKQTYLIMQIDDVQIIDAFVENNYLRLRSIHRFKNLILIYYFNGEQLIVEQELLLNDYQFVRPIIYSKSKQLIIIAALTNFNEKVYLFINANKVITLIKYIYTNQFNAFLSNNLFLYSDNNSNLKILSVNEYIFKLKIDFQFLSNSYQIDQNFDIFYKEGSQIQQIQGIIQLNIINKCFEIQNYQNKSILFQSYNLLPLNLGKIFFGPIDQFKTNNSDIQLIGPFLKTKIKDCSDNSKDLCQQQIKITFFENQISHLMCLLNHSDTINLSYCNFYEMSVDLKIFKYFYIIEEQLFVVFTSEIDLLHKIMIFYFDSTSLILTQIYENNFRIQSDIFYYSKRTLIRYLDGQFFITLRDGNKIINQQFILSIKKVNQLKMHSAYSDIIKIKNTEEDYILFQQSNEIKYGFVFIFIKIQNFEEILIQQINLTFEEIKHLLNGQFPDFNVEKFKSDSTQSLIESSKINNLIKTIFIMITQDTTFQILLQIDIDTQKYDFHIFKIIRNPVIKNQLFIDFCDSQILILQDTINNKLVYYLYDLRDDTEMYDYINKFENKEFILYKFNNTFYFFQQNENKQLIIGQIGFVLELLGQEKHEKVIIIAENQISEAIVEVIFTNPQQEYSFQLNYIIIAILVLLLIIYLIRRQLLKKQQLKIKIENDDI